MCAQILQGVSKICHRFAPEFVASVNIQEAYFHIPIFPALQSFLGFAVGNQRFQFVNKPAKPVQSLQC